MKEDPIVEEVHKVREQISKECGYNLSLIIERLRRNEKQRLNAKGETFKGAKARQSEES